MTRSTLLTLLGVSAIGLSKSLSKGSLGRIRMGVLSRNEIRNNLIPNVREHQENLMAPFYDGEISLTEAMNNALANPYLYHSDEYNVDANIINISDQFLKTNLFLFYNPNIYKPSDAYLFGNKKGKLKTREEKRDLRRLLFKLVNKSFEEKDFPEFFYDPSKNQNDNWVRYVKTLLKYYTSLFPDENIQENFITIVFEKENTAGQFRLRADGNIYFESDNALLRSLRHEARHSIDYQLKGRSDAFKDGYSIHSLPKKHKRKIADINEPRDYRRLPHAEQPAELVTYIGDVHDEITGSDLFIDDDGNFREEPRKESIRSRVNPNSFNIVNYCFVNLYGGRNESGVPSEVLLETLTRILSDKYRSNIYEKKNRFHSEDYYNMMREELLSTAYDAGRTIYNQFQDYFIENYDPNVQIV